MNKGATFAGVVLCLSSWSALAQEPLKINLLSQDAYAIRMMKVVPTLGPALQGTSLSFNIAEKKFLIKGGAGERTMALADFKQIDFTQEVTRMNPAAQTPPWKIEVTPGETVAFQIPEDALTIDAGILSIMPAWKLPANTGAGPTRGATTATAPRTPEPDVLEPVTLTYEKATKSFRLQGRYFHYAKVITGGGGSGVFGGTKPIQ